LKLESRLTVDSDGRGVAGPRVGYVLGHAAVVCRIGKTGRNDNQVTLGRDEKVLVKIGVDFSTVLKPIDLWWGFTPWRMAPHFNLTSLRHLLGVGRNFKLFPQVWKKARKSYDDI